MCTSLIEKNSFASREIKKKEKREREREREKERDGQKERNGRSRI
jgi:hypothetical protein